MYGCWDYVPQRTEAALFLRNCTISSHDCPCHRWGRAISPRDGRCGALARWENLRRTWTSGWLGLSASDLLEEIYIIYKKRWVIRRPTCRNQHLERKWMPLDEKIVKESRHVRQQGKKQLADLETAYTACSWKPCRDFPLKTCSPPSVIGLRADIAAHFIGWETRESRRAGCSALREGAEPFYFYGWNETTTEKSTQSSSRNSRPLTAKSY